MKLLAIDSSARAASAAVAEDGRLLCESFVNVGLTHSETLLPMLDAMLRSARLSMEDIGGLAVSAGPGSFTGLRIGIAAVKGLAFAQELPCVGVSTLEAIAHNLLGQSCIACAVMDARCQQVYTASFMVNGDMPERITPDEALTIAELGERLAARGGGQPIVFVGDGAQLCYNELGVRLNARLAPEHLRFQRASGVCAAAAGHWGEAAHAGLLIPAYLRLPQAERELLKRGENQK